MRSRVWDATCVLQLSLSLNPPWWQVSMPGEHERKASCRQEDNNCVFWPFFSLSGFHSVPYMMESQECFLELMPSINTFPNIRMFSTAS